MGVITPYDAQKKKIKNEIINQARVNFYFIIFMKLFDKEIPNRFWFNR